MILGNKNKVFDCVLYKTKAAEKGKTLFMYCPPIDKNMFSAMFSLFVIFMETTYCERFFNGTYELCFYQRALTWSCRTYVCWAGVCHWFDPWAKRWIEHNWDQTRWRRIHMKVLTINPVTIVLVPWWTWRIRVSEGTRNHAIRFSNVFCHGQSKVFGREGVNLVSNLTQKSVKPEIFQ